MKKSLIALAVAGAVSAPAMAATSNVDIYGNIGLSYDYINTDSNVPGADKKLSRVSSNSSRIGFKGSEDLGGGLAAIWQIEQQFDWDNGTQNLVGTLGNNTNLNLRNTFLGLSSKSMGTVLMGKHDTPYKIATGKLDIFGDTSADYNNIVANVGGQILYDLRPGNVLAYVTPTFNGIHGAIAYVFGNEVGNGAAPNQSAWSAMGMYDNGPIFASLAYEQHTNLNAVGEDRHAWKLGAGYNFGDGQVGFIYEDAQDIVGVSAQNRKAYYLNGQYNMGNIALKAAYGHAGKLDTIADSGANTYSLGVDYNLSKRSRLYAQYTKTNNDTNGQYSLGAGGGSSINLGTNTNPVAGAGADPSVFSIGMRHTF